METAEGRALSGAVDARTDESTLWLRLEEDGIVLSVPVSWNTISSAAVGDEAIGVEELRERRGELGSEGPRWLIPEVEIPVDAGSTARKADFEKRRSCSSRLLGRRRAWGAGAEPGCGLGLPGESGSRRGAGWDRGIGRGRGRRRGAGGGAREFRAELFGESGALSRDRQPEFGVLDRWSQRVRAEDFVDGVATYCLPFRRAAPEWQFDLLPDAVLTVQLGATGHGNFSATAPVVLREFNPLRDDLQQHRGTRFLPNEVQGWRPQDPFGAELGRWQWWGR